jgi:hypothetical protein
MMARYQWPPAEQNSAEENTIASYGGLMPVAR